MKNESAEKKQRTANSTYKKLAVKWLNEALCFVSSFVVADSLMLRYRQLLVAANRYALGQKYKQPGPADCFPGDIWTRFSNLGQKTG